MNILAGSAILTPHLVSAFTIRFYSVRFHSFHKKC
jgi:hypothetical protein